MYMIDSLRRNDWVKERETSGPSRSKGTPADHTIPLPPPLHDHGHGHDQQGCTIFRSILFEWRREKAVLALGEDIVAMYGADVFITGDFLSTDSRVRTDRQTQVEAIDKENGRVLFGRCNGGLTYLI